ncbi:hypothetical protein SCALIN_C46_0013 [Candidatus Scalindua japonica]|uniref:Uncharacterized protein n=1 Tax=Candidatus Scalindua japonica TaxID=1284222 RepID=A0A286U4E1_9BACT|nr:hypothetical protein SCALIN_C46_0013 [Candidatus Scalindua japonica]
MVVPIIVVLCASIGSYGLYKKRKASRYENTKQGLQQGSIYAKLNRHNDAIKEYKKALEKNPQDINILYQLGISYIKLKEFDKAVSAFKTALKIKPNYSKARFQLAVIRLTKAKELRKLGESESVVLEILLDAEDICREIIEKDNNFIQAYALLGEVHFLQGLLDDAIIDYKRILKIDNSYVNGHIALARLYVNKGSLDMAEEECKLVLSEFEPDNKMVQFLLATIYEQKGMYDEAVSLLMRMSEDAPGNTMVNIQLGLLYLKLSKFDEALEQADKVASPLPPAVYFIKGSVLLQRKKFKEAITLLKEAVISLPKLVEPHYFLAHALSGIGRFEEAKTEFKTAINLAPNFVPAKIGLAKLLSSAGWHKETIDLCNEVLELKPDNVDAMQLLGLAYIKEQDFENAEKQFRKIQEIDSSVGDINMAYLSLTSGQLSKCIRQCEEILHTDPETVKIYDILGLAHIRRGDFDSGIEQFKKALKLNQNSISTLVNLAKVYVVAERIDEAKKILKTTLSTNPDNLKVLSLLAGIYQRESNVDESAKIFERIIEIDPDLIDGYGLASMYFLQGKTDESIDLYNKALKLIPENVVILTNLALSYQQKENYVASLKYCTKAIELRPENPSYKFMLANIFIAKGAHSAAKEQIESIPSFSGDQKNAFLELIDLSQLDEKKGKQIALALNKIIFLRQGGLLDLAIKECKKAIEIFPENIIPKVILANTYLSLKRNEEAIAVYSEIVKEKPEFASSYYDLGMAYILSGNQDQALSTYQMLDDNDEGSVSARLVLAGTLMKDGDAEKAEKAAKIVGDVIKIDPNNLMAQSLLGKMSLADKDYSKAETAFTKMIELKGDTFEGHFNMARMKLSQGEYEECIQHCKVALRTKPVDVRIHNILGVAYMRKGMLKDAALSFNKIIDINSDFIPAYLNLAHMNMVAQKPGIASLLYKAALKVDSDSVEARIGLGNSYALLNDNVLAIAEFETVIKKYPNNIDAHVALARSNIALGNNTKAKQAVMNALSIDTDNPIARSVLTKIYVIDEDMQQAIKQLEWVLVKSPKTIEVYDLGVLYVDIGEFDKAISVYKQGVDNFPGNHLLWCNLAVTYQLGKDYKSAKTAFNKALTIQPDGIIPNLCMIHLYMAKGEIDNARQHLKNLTIIGDVNKRRYLRLLELCGKDVEVADKVSHHLSRAIIYSNNRWSKRIINEYDELIKMVPGNAVAYNAKADNLVLIRQYDKAIKAYKKIIEIEPESPDAYIKLAGVYRRSGDNDEALAQFRRVIRVDPENTIAHLNIGILTEAKGLLEESVNFYNKVIELDPNSSVAYNNLAWLYASKMKNKIEEALVLAKKAKELNPNNPAIADTLGWIYYLDADYDNAVSELRAAARNATWNPSIRYHLGAAYYKKGILRDALREMERALKISSTFPEAEDAKEIIEKIIINKVRGNSSK